MFLLVYCLQFLQCTGLLCHMITIYIKKLLIINAGQISKVRNLSLHEKYLNKMNLVMTYKNGKMLK